ncbi:MAG: DUF2269 domain-containing protein [Nitrosomonas sp.]|uniref:DUF2269 domain-containing protein n=1 Tax=Nitrosomonas sp. TaxID=42353 RepID=UPI0027319B17|nr:DUF2269 domain-containing protein [Nitrosomonas sp.]MDP1549916.1 DUF2269 domain-containing protein [Nitrosomonas sp.]
MIYELLKLAHIIGAVLIGGGLIGVWLSDLRSRQSRELVRFSESVRNIAVFYDGVVVPGAIVLLISGTWLIVAFYGGWNFISIPWLAGMVFLFVFEFIEGNTVTRIYFMRLRRLTQEALHVGEFTPELEKARAENIPAFTHFLDLPMLFLIITLGALKPDTWEVFVVGSLVAITLAAALTLFIPRLYPWTANQ